MGKIASVDCTTPPPPPCETAEANRQLTGLRRRWSGRNRAGASCSYAGGAHHRRRWHSSCNSDLNICAQSAAGLCSDQGVCLTAVENCSPVRFDWTREVNTASPLSYPLLCPVAGSRLLAPAFTFIDYSIDGDPTRWWCFMWTITRTVERFYRSIWNERPCEVAYLSIFD
jgi:hypothetical protein